MKTKTFNQAGNQVCRILDLAKDGDAADEQRTSNVLRIFRRYAANFAANEPLVANKRTGNVALPRSVYSK